MRTKAILTVVLVVGACTAPVSTATPSPTQLGATASPQETATAAASPTTPASPPSASPFVGGSTDVTGVTANALGTPQGNWIFFTQLVPIADTPLSRLEVWAITPSGQQRLAFSYDTAVGGVPESLPDSDPYLRRQFSPDGRQVVVSTLLNGLVVVDLPSGQARRLGVGGTNPSWSKDGKTIAYIATVARPDPQRVPPERAIWVVPAVGGSPRELINVGYSSTSPEWSADSSLLLLQLKDGVGMVEVASGREVSGGRIPSANYATGAHWRRGSAQAVVTIIRPDDAQVVVYDHDHRVTRSLAQFPRPFDPSPCQCPKGEVPWDPRWSPAGTDEALLVLFDEKTWRAPVAILEARSGQLTKLPVNALQATWSPDGKQVIYIARTDRQLGGALRVYDRASGADRELVGMLSGATKGSIVTVIY